jgi:hypothetical protein
MSTQLPPGRPLIGRKPHSGCICGELNKSPWRLSSAGAGTLAPTPGIPTIAETGFGPSLRQPKAGPLRDTLREAGFHTT